ncbi:hypothetical protein [Nitrosomonas sp. Nm34]|uniref:hypothetical protein n=1 Tax=Nitrosomonas sp. Nm34 TaxID=1881055 RepID=UPI001C317763|nr:hypothetical protein [Nitrosomonas sp. Nm34]
MSNSQDEFAKNYSDANFWEKLGAYALAAGKEVIEKALWLYYVFKNEETPAWDKAVIIEHPATLSHQSMEYQTSPLLLVTLMILVF